MTSRYVLSIPNDLISLEIDMREWLNLPFNLRKHGNDACTELYGCTNEQLYNILKAEMIKNDIPEEDTKFQLEHYIRKTKRILKESAIHFNVDQSNISKLPLGYTDDGQINDRLSKIDRANKIMINDDDMVIINDFINDSMPDYDINYLEKKFNLYNSVNNQHRILSNNYSMDIWGKSVEDMYHYMKNKFMNISAEKDNIKPSLEQQRLDSYRNTVVSESPNDLVQHLIRYMDCNLEDKSRSLYESTILENFGDTITLRNHTYRQDMPGVMPFLTYYEYLHDARGLDQRKIHAKNPFCYVLNRINNRKNIEDAYNRGDKDALIEMGWNPYIAPTDNAFKRAYERQIEFFDEYYN